MIPKITLNLTHIIIIIIIIVIIIITCWVCDDCC